MVLPFAALAARTAATGVARGLLGRSAARAGTARFTTRIQWFGPKTLKGIRGGMDSRLKIAAQLTRDKVVLNIRKPVLKRIGPRSGKVQVIERSKPGEFPRLDTGRLSKDIFWERRGEMEYIVGTTLHYGLVLEVSRRLKRKFLRRTLDEMRPTINRIISSGPPLGKD